MGLTESKNNMKFDEKIAEKFLRFYGFKTVKYEPVKNCTPDFLCDGKIAVEVRRLNKNFYGGEETVGLEKEEFSLTEKLNKLVHGFGTSENNNCWVVSFSFSRPVENWKTLSKKIKKSFDDFVEKPFKENGIIFKEDNFEIEVFRLDDDKIPYIFDVGYCDDMDSGGWTIEDMESNIKYCIMEKTRKIENVKTKYNEWWLVLINHITVMMSESDEKRLIEEFKMEHDFDKVIIVNPFKPSKWFEI